MHRSCSSPCPHAHLFSLLMIAMATVTTAIAAENRIRRLIGTAMAMAVELSMDPDVPSVA